MKIALIVPGFSINEHDWAIPALQDFACYLARQHEIHVFSLRYPAQGTYRFCRLTHHATGGNTDFGLKSMRVMGRTMRAIIREHKRKPFDLLHAFWLDEPAYTAVLTGRWLNIPVMASAGGGELVYFSDIDYGTQGSSVRRRLIRHVLRRANLITAGSEYQLKLCRQHGAAGDKLRLAPLGVNTNLFCPQEMPDWMQPTVIQAASLVPVKDQAMLLDVLAQVKTAVPAIKLILAGGGPLESDLHRQANQLGLNAHIEWRQKVDHPHMPAVYREAHLYIQTSRHESQGLSVLEALACGVPVLGTPVGILPQVAYALPTADRSTLAQQIISVFANKAEYLEKRAFASAMVEEAYRLPIAVDRFLQMYVTLLP